MIKILIADDHILIREGFKKILDNEIDIKVVGEAKNAKEVLDFLKINICDIIVLDISLPDRSGLDILKDIKLLTPNSKVLILSMHPEETFAMRAYKSGAMGYITKESASSELVKAIRKVISGRQYVSENLAERLAFNLGNNEQKLAHENLSNREFQVLCRIGEGTTVSQIAEELSLSISTINTYRTRILEKIGCETNASLIQYVLKNNLLE